MGEALVGAVVGLIVGLVPFGYTVWRDKEQARTDKMKREEQARNDQLERDERARADANRAEAEKQRQLEDHRERMRTVATRYGDLLGKTMALLEAVVVDADNADQLLWSATEAHSELQGHAQGALLTQFTDSPPVIWSDRACRKLLREGLTVAGNARSQRLTGADARATQQDLQRLTAINIDGGPRDLFRWASDEACTRWPKLLTSFSEDAGAEANARYVQHVLDFEPPP